MKKERKVWAITLIVLWWLAPNQTNAQQEQDSTRTLNEVVVTSSKFPKNQVETGKVLTVIDEAQLQRSSGKDISQLLNEQVGLIIIGANSNSGKDKSVFLRGASGQYTLILLDGIPLNDPSGAGGAFDLRLLPIDQVERIEILKGSQSTLYGTDAIAGVINIITKKKEDKVIGGFGTLSYGTYNTFKGNASIAGGTKSIDYNVSYTRFQTDGISEAKDESGSGNFDKDKFKQNSVQINLGIKPRENIAIHPFFRYTDFEGDYDGGAFSDDPTAVNTAKLLNYGLSGQYKLSRGAVNIQYGRSETDRVYKNQYDTSSYHGNFDNAEVYVNQNLGDYLQILAGVNYQNLNMEDTSAVKKNPSINITSPYVSFFIKDLNGFSAELGGRYNNHSEFGKAFTYSINPSYLIQKQIKIFANYSTGFKAPTLNELYGQYGANDKLKPQESKSAEAGVQYYSRNKIFDVRATLFSRKITNVIFYGDLGFVNLNKQDDYGFEFEPTINVNDKLSIRGFYAFVDGELTTKTSANTDTTYHNLIRRPKNSIGVNIGYQVFSDFYISLNLKWVGNRKDTFFDLSDYSTRSVELDAFHLLDVYAEYKMVDGRIKLFVDAKNILNQKYEEVYGYNTMRFNLNTGVSFKL